jgi:hypothetical protein
MQGQDLLLDRRNVLAWKVLEKKEETRIIIRRKLGF